MKSKEKSIWIYCIVLLAAAILLILISAISLHDPMAELGEEKESPFYQNVEKGVVELIGERDKIVVENSELKHKIEGLETALAEQNKEVSRLQDIYTATERVILLEQLVEKKSWQEAVKTYDAIQKELLSETTLTAYTKCEKILNKEGYIEKESTEK